MAGARAVAPPGHVRERRLVRALRAVAGGRVAPGQGGANRAPSTAEVCGLPQPGPAFTAPTPATAPVAGGVGTAAHSSAATSAPAAGVAPVGRWEGVWSADALQACDGDVVSSGYPVLDAELPGGGWPLGALVELLPPAGAAAPVWPLIGPVLAARQRAAGGTVVLVNPPHEPFLPALAAAGLDVAQLLWVPGATAAAQLWASEQALRCADVAAVLAWLPRVRSTELRRLHAAASQGGGSLLFVVRPAAAAAEASCARLRLRVTAVASAPGAAAGDMGTGGDGSASQLRIDLLKRRGPPLAAPLWLPAQGPALRALLAASAAPVPGAAGAVVLPFQAAETEARHGEPGHALDRLAVAA